MIKQIKILIQQIEILGKLCRKMQLMINLETTYTTNQDWSQSVEQT